MPRRSISASSRGGVGCQTMPRHPLRALGWLTAITLVVLAFVFWKPWLGWSAALPLLLVGIAYWRDPTSKGDRYRESPVPPGGHSGGSGAAG
jgi:hypothetical protein